MAKVPVVFVRSPYNYDLKAASDEVGLECLDPSLAKQEFAAESDINNMMERFGQGYKMPDNIRVPSYGDFTGVSDFRTALHAIDEAENSFMLLPANVRKEFDNDPAAFVDFCSSAGNEDKLRAIGLLPPKPAIDATPAGQPATPQAPSGEAPKGP